MSLTQPLDPSKQVLLQHLLAAHVMHHDEAVAMFEKIGATNCRTLEECFRDINAQLMPGFGLEIATASFGGTRYHAVVNPYADDVAKASFKEKLSPSQREYIRNVFETLAQDEDDNEANDNVGTRMNLLNLRTKLDEKYKLNIEETEYCLDRLVAEKWLSTDVVEDKENRRKSLKSVYKLGPRSYLELRQLLQDFGVTALPQYIYHRSS
mmetsp:Transcript_18480/g.27918  ORF Transcript_18480/g.27918 Transcript_18480/m.27918 type:complete len:209 (+) Transcript_18480:68-694(+)